MAQHCAILSKVNPSCPICLPCLDGLIAAEVTVNENRLKGMLKYKIQLPSCVSSQEGTRKDCQAGPAHVSIREQTMMFSIYSLKPQ